MTNPKQPVWTIASRGVTLGDFKDDDDAYVRVDARLRLVDVAELDAIVDQVQKVAESLYVAAKPYLIR